MAGTATFNVSSAHSIFRHPSLSVLFSSKPSIISTPASRKFHKIYALTSNNVKVGTNIIVDGAPWRVLEFLHVKPGKGAAFVRTKMSNYVTGNRVEKTFRAGSSIKIMHAMKNPGAIINVGSSAGLYPIYMDHIYSSSKGGVILFTRSLTPYKRQGIRSNVLCPEAITSLGTKKGELFLADVNTQLKNKNITTDIKVETSSNHVTTIMLDEPCLGLKSILSFKVPDQSS